MKTIYAIDLVSGEERTELACKLDRAFALSVIDIFRETFRSMGKDVQLRQHKKNYP